MESLIRKIVTMKKNNSMKNYNNKISILKIKN